MQKLPVGKVAGLSYSLLFHEFRTVLRLTWLPLLLGSILGFGLEWIELDGIEKNGPHAPLGGRWLSFFLSGFLVGGLSAAIASGTIIRFILFGDRRPGKYLTARLGMVEVSILLLAAATLGIVLLVLYLADPLAEVLFSLGTMDARTAAIAAVSVAAVVVLASMYLGTRLALLAPVTAIEGRIDFGRAFGLTRGNFWRLTAALLLVLVPVSFAEGFLAGLASGVIKHIELSHVPEWLRSAAHDAHVRKSIIAWQFPVRFLGTMATTALSCALVSYSYAIFVGRLDPYADAARDEAD